jgi:hypothetical protein
VVWFVVWVVLVLGAAAVFFLLGRDLWRKGRALAREIGEAADRLSAVSDRLAELDGGERPAVGSLGDVRSESSSPRPRR